MGNTKLIVHADDLGLSDKINEGIIRAHSNGIVTSASLMANAEAFEAAVNLCLCNPNLDVGIHLTLTEEMPILGKSRIPTLLDKDECFFDHATTFAKKYLARQISISEITNELDAQICKVLDHGIKVTHLDSHQHIHMLPGIRAVVGELARKYTIPAIRHPKESLLPYMLMEKGGFTRLLQLVALNTFCSFAKISDARQPDHFYGFFYGGRLTKDRLWKLLHHIHGVGVSEIMCHPGYCDDSGRYNHWAYRWNEEMDALTSNEIKAYIKYRGIELISYADI